MKYFICNAVIICFFFVVILVLVVASSGTKIYLWSLVIVIVELFYNIGVYIAVLVSIDPLHGRVKKMLMKIFRYFLIYVLLLVCRNIFAMLLINNFTTTYFIPYIIFERFVNIYLTIAICLTMKDLKLNSKAPKSGKSSSTS